MSTGLTVRGNRTSGLLAVLLALAMVASLVTAVPLTAAAQEQEPNDSRDAAQQIPTGEQVTGDAPSNDEDWFAFTVERGETINVTASAETRSDTKFWLKNPGGGFIQSDTASGGSITLSTTASTTDIYYIEVSANGDRLGAAYNLTVELPGKRLGLPNDRFEVGNPPIGNEGRANATAVEPGTYANLGMVDDDEDWFRVRAAEDARVTVNTSYDASANTLSVALVDSSGTTVTSGEDGLATNVSATGTYYVRVTGQPDAEATYALDLNVSATGPPQLPGGQGQPGDPDGDGLFEDANGDGTFNVLDVALFLDVFGSTEVSGTSASFDFNGDGSINILDVAALLDET